MVNFRSSLALSAVVFAVANSGVIANAAINSGDHLTIHVYNHPELSTNAVVDSRGTIELPVVGTVHAEGLESKQVAYTIRQRIKPYVPFPDVDVQDTNESQTLFISGASAGVLPYAPNETLSAAVAEITKTTPDSTQNANALIGRFDYSRLDLKKVIIRRSGRTLGPYNLVALRSSGDPGPTLFANDTIAFANKPVAVTVLGAVSAPGTAYLWPDEPLSNAIEQVGGTAGAASSGRIQLTRPGEEPQTVAFGNPVFNHPAQPGDIIVVPTAPRITVSGLVEKPGTVTLSNDTTLISAIGAAGGYDTYAELRKVQVVHDGVRTQYNIVALAHGDMSQNPQLHDGDLVYVPEGYKVNWGLIWQGLGATGGLSNLYYNLNNRR